VLLIPPALLSKLYVKGSLNCSPENSEFKLKNVLAPSTIIGFEKVEVDGAPYPLDKVLLSKKNSVRPAASVTPQAPFLLNINEEVKVTLEGLKLSPGFHRIALHLESKEVGEVEIPVEDTVWES